MILKGRKNALIKLVRINYDTSLLLSLRTHTVRKKKKKKNLNYAEKIPVISEASES